MNGSFINIKPKPVDDLIDRLLNAIGLDPTNAEEVKDSKGRSIGGKNMENKAKKPFEANIDNRKYVVKRCYVGSDSKLHVAPENTVLAFCEETEDGKLYPIKEVAKDGGSWFKQLLMAIVERVATSKKK